MQHIWPNGGRTAAEISVPGQSEKYTVIDISYMLMTFSDCVAVKT